MTDDDKFPSDLADRFQLRMPSGMRDRLAARAKAHGRSSNTEAVFALKMWLDQADWIDASARGDDAGPWPGPVPDPFPEHTRLQILQAAKLNGRNADAEVLARIQASFEATSSTLSVDKPSASSTSTSDARLKALVGEAMAEVLSNPDLLRRFRQLEYAKILRTDTVVLEDEAGRQFGPNDRLADVGEVEHGPGIYPPLVQGDLLIAEERERQAKVTAARNFSKRPAAPSEPDKS